MPAVRFSRDKRGYEYVYLVHTPMRRGKPGRTRVLYWYRTPPGVRIGRRPFDPDVQKLIEQQNPGLTFDWDTIINTPFPPPDMTEFWRERRRAEKAARQERRAQEAQDSQEAPGVEDGASGDVPSADGDVPVDNVADAAEPGDIAVVSTESADGESAPAGEPGAPRKRRRRRGGRRRRGAAGESIAAGDADSETNADAQAPDDVDGDPSEPTDPASEGE